MKQVTQTTLIDAAILNGAKIYASISGGKDGQAMTKALADNGYHITGLIHADLGRVEWAESMGMCTASSIEFNTPLHVIQRTDKVDMLGHWQKRMNKLQGTGKPFWSSSKSRYCTSDLKREPINNFLRNCGNDFIISCEGIRAGESVARQKKNPLTIREGITSTYYKGMTVEQAIASFKVGKRLVLTYYPIFEFSIDDVWNTYGLSASDLNAARQTYKATKQVPAWWVFHNAYVYGNERVSCMFCVLGSINDLGIAAHHNPSLLNTLIDMENISGSTFKNNWSLKNLLPAA